VLEPAWWPGKKLGKPLAVETQYTIAITIRTMPSRTAGMISCLFLVM
jgi:hypothetical protein